MALFTTVEKYNDDEFINHHGFQRNVKDKDANLFQTNPKESDNGLNGISNVRMIQNKRFSIYLSTLFENLGQDCIWFMDDSKVTKHKKPRGYCEIHW